MTAAPTTLSYEYTNCDAAPGAFVATKQLSAAAAQHVAGSHTIFVVLRAVDGDGNILFDTPGFAVNDRPTITCDSIHPVSGAFARVTGQFVPRG